MFSGGAFMRLDLDQVLDFTINATSSELDLVIPKPTGGEAPRMQ